MPHWPHTCEGIHGFDWDEPPGEGIHGFGWEGTPGDHEPELPPEPPPELPGHPPPLHPTIPFVAVAQRNLGSCSTLESTGRMRDVI